MNKSSNSWREITDAITEPVSIGAQAACKPADPDAARSSALIKSFPFDAVLGEYWEVGKHFVSPHTLSVLSKVRDSLQSHSQADPSVSRLVRFLDVALDKHDGRYDYRTYLALPLMPLPYGPEYVGCIETAALQRDRLVVHLIGDLLRFELAAHEGRPVPFPQMRADAALLDKRCRLALLAIEPALQRLGWQVAPHEATAHTATPLELAARVSRVVDENFSADEKQLLRMTMMPVYTIHDEYMFLRVLQSFETVFAYICSALENTVSAIDSGRIPLAVEHLASCESSLHDVGPLFSLLGTMRIEAFQTFRQFTEGASAIQSRGYKTMEALCGRPSAERLDSLGYRSVPEVRDRVLQGCPNIQDSMDRAQQQGRVPAGDLELMRNRMREFEDRVLQWRKTHHSLAVRMLGANSGTGYTEGTPYLQAVMGCPLFKKDGQAR